MGCYQGDVPAVLTNICCCCLQGLEHCIAYSFVYQLALKLGGPPLPPFIVNNLLACTLGNVIGGGCFVAAAYSLAFGSLEKKAVGQSIRIWRRVIQPALFCRAKNNSNSSSGSSAVNSTDDANVTSDNTGAADTGMVTERLAELAAARGVVGKRSSIRMPADVSGDAGAQVLVGAPSAPLQSLQAASEPTEGCFDVVASHRTNQQHCCAPQQRRSCADFESSSDIHIALLLFSTTLLGCLSLPAPAV